MATLRSLTKTFSAVKQSLTSNYGRGCLRHLQTSSCRPSSERWQLMSAVCLERIPIITSELTPQETEFNELMLKLEKENSCMSDHELRHIDDLKLVERRKDDDYEETEAEAIRQTAMDSEDVWEAEMEAFTPANRITEFDEANDLKSSHRMLDKKLVLLVKQKLGEGSQWCMPQGRHEDGESMRQSAERALRTTCGENLDTLFMGNAPCGFYKYKFPEDVQGQEGAVGAKVFFFKAQLQSGQVESAADELLDHQWLTRSQVLDTVLPPYKNAVKRFILEL